MEHKTTQFGQEIGFGDIEKGQELLIYREEHNDTVRGTAIECAYDWWRCELSNGQSFYVLRNMRVWLVRELRIVVVDSIRPGQKPIAILEHLDQGFLSKYAPNLDGFHPCEDEDWTSFSSQAKDFSSVGDAFSYLQKFLTSYCEVVFLAPRK
jgi:hypothetical protein